MYFDRKHHDLLDDETERSWDLVSRLTARAQSLLFHVFSPGIAPIRFVNLHVINAIANKYRHVRYAWPGVEEFFLRFDSIIGLDSGCVMTLIDSRLAKTLQLELHHTANIPVAGIGSKHVSSAYVFTAITMSPKSQ